MQSVVLPDYLDLSRELTAAFIRYVRAHSHVGGVAGLLATRIIHEGERQQVKPAGANEFEEVKLYEASTQSNVTFEEVEHITIATILREASKYAKSMHEQMSKHTFDFMNEITSKTGNIVDAGGEPLTLDHLYKFLELMPQEFDPRTGRTTATIVAPPEILPKLLELKSRIQSNVTERNRFAELEIRKRDEFRSREMDRDLAG